jgi:hypothetical protein
MQLWQPPRPIIRLFTPRNALGLGDVPVWGSANSETEANDDRRSIGKLAMRSWTCLFSPKHRGYLFSLTQPWKQLGVLCFGTVRQSDPCTTGSFSQWPNARNIVAIAGAGPSHAHSRIRQVQKGPAIATVSVLELVLLAG